MVESSGDVMTRNQSAGLGAALADGWPFNSQNALESELLEQTFARMERELFCVALVNLGRTEQSGRIEEAGLRPDA